MKDMKTIYVVLPFTNNYKSPISEDMLVFEDREKAVEYSDNFKWVEITTTTLNPKPLEI